MLRALPILIALWLGGCAAEAQNRRIELVTTSPAEERPLVAVPDFTLSDPASPWSGAKLAGMTDSDLLASGRFVHVARGDLEKVAQEQQLAGTAGFDERSAPQLGKLLGARYVLVGRLVSFAPLHHERGFLIKKRFQRVTVTLQATLYDADSGRAVSGATGSGAFEKALWEVKEAGPYTEQPALKDIDKDVVEAALTDAVHDLVNHLPVPR